MGGRERKEGEREEKNRKTLLYIRKDDNYRVLWKHTASYTHTHTQYCYVTSNIGAFVNYTCARKLTQALKVNFKNRALYTRDSLLISYVYKQN